MKVLRPGGGRIIKVAAQGVPTKKEPAVAAQGVPTKKEPALAAQLQTPDIEITIPKAPETEGPTIIGKGENNEKDRF